MTHLTRTTLALVLLVFAAAGMAETDTDIRQSLTSEGNDIQRGHVGDGVVSYNEHAPLALGATAETSSITGKPAADPRQSTATIGVSTDPDFWFYDVDVALFADADRDGYYWGIDLLFDADTNYGAADVFAVLYLSYDGGPWNASVLSLQS